MSSNRPDTSYPNQSNNYSATNLEKSLPVITAGAYKPRINDLVVALPKIREATDLHVPSSFLQSEAIDSSLLVGRGASFTVTRQAVPPDTKTMMDCVDVGKLITLKMPFKPQDRPKYIIFKSPRIQFQANGEPSTPQDGRALQSVLTEIHALLHPPLLRHPNIIDILGVAWGSNHTNPLHRLPVLVVEYGNKGTLADVQLEGSPLSGEQKSQISLGIASGLQALHNESIVHGDLKPENIIMCSNENNILVPKLGDFGFAIIEAVESSKIMLGGTRTWRAPESYKPLPVSMLKHTDIYSFGLVVWSIALNGKDPFTVLLPESTKWEDRNVALDQLKVDDKVREMSRFENWVPYWQTHRTRSSLEDCCLKHPDHDLSTTFSTACSVSACSGYKDTTTCASLRQQPFFSSLEGVTTSTLSLYPEQRNLLKAIELLEKDLNMDTVTDLEFLKNKNKSPVANHNIGIGYMTARTEDLLRHQELPDDKPEDGTGIQCPSKITIQVHEGKSAEEIKWAFAPGVPICIIQTPKDIVAMKMIDRSWTSIFFEMNFGIVHEGGAMSRPLSFIWQIPKGKGLSLKIPKRTSRPSFRINRFFHGGAATYEVMFSPSSTKPVAKPSSLKKLDWALNGYKTEIYSWQNTRELDPAIQRLVVDTLLHRTDVSTSVALCAFFLNGYGVPVDTDAGLGYLVQSAQKGHLTAMAYVYRVAAACQKNLSSDIPVTLWLESAAINGSRMALEDLAQVDETKAQKTKDLLRNRLGGIGGMLYCPGQWKYHLDPDKLRQENLNLDRFGSPSGLPDVIVTARGDGFIHAAAANGAYQLVDRLIKGFSIDVNQRNVLGETALLCAARSGHLEIVKMLLNHGASASLEAENGETPLHWLISFSGLAVPGVGKALIEKGGAIIDTLTNQVVSHFSSQMDVDIQLPGTPLLWAVRNNRTDIVSYLLSVGADPRIRSLENDTGAPLYWSAFMHHSECLQLLIEHLEAQSRLRKGPSLGGLLISPLVQLAIHAADRFSMIIRNGVAYLDRLEATLRFLQSKTRHLSFNVTYDYATPIGYAVSEAHDEATEVLLKIGWGIDDLNKPSSSNFRTPLLDAVRWNRRHIVQLLLSYGANPLAMALNPYDEGKHNWGALHIFAEQAHNEDLAVVSDLLEAGVTVDGHHEEEVETPLHVAVRKNAFKLADFLLLKGADLNARSVRSSLVISTYPLTGLGHSIALNARHCIPSLRYLLSDHSAVTTDTVHFIVEPTRYLSALHLCALGPNGLLYTSGDTLSTKDFDYETNRRITRELLDWFPESEHMEERCSMQSRTALHLAAEYGNYGVVEELVKAGADTLIKDDRGETAADIAKSVHVENSKVLERMLEWLT